MGFSAENIEKRLLRQFEILRDIAVSSSHGRQLAATADDALKAAGSLVGLSAASLIIWAENHQSALTVSYAARPEEKQILDDLERDIFAEMRKRKNLSSAYMTFGGVSPLSVFTQPVRKGGRILGTVIGIKTGDSLAREDLFLEALAAALSVSVIAGGIVPESVASDERIRDERAKAIRQTVTTVNHEINNPLTAVLGNIQLLLMRSEAMDSDLVKKLRIVEESALRIKEVTQKLMTVTGNTVTEYTPGMDMLDLGENENSP
jgi:signal transduction histidine kinase